MSFEQAAATPQAAVLALQALCKKSQVGPGDKVLINGAGGGVGTFAVQIARSLGAEVTAVDKADKLDMLKALGADHVIDYEETDFTRTGHRFDFILDVIATRSVRAYRRALSPGGTLVIVGGTMPVIFKVALTGLLSSKIGITEAWKVLAHKPNSDDLDSVTEMFEQGTVTPVIDSTYSLTEVPQALRYFGEGNVAGKVVINVSRREHDGPR